MATIKWKPEAELQSAKIALWKRLPSFLGLTIFSLIGRKDLMADSH